MRAAVQEVDPSIILLCRVLIGVPLLFGMTEFLSKPGISLKRRRKNKYQPVDSQSDNIDAATDDESDFENDSPIRPQNYSPSSRQSTSSSHSRRLTRTQHRDLFLLGNIGVSCHLLCVMYGLSLTNAVTAGIFVAATPVFSSMIAICLPSKEFPKFNVLGVLIGSIGIILAFDWSGRGRQDRNYLGGCALFVLGNIFFTGFLHARTNLVKEIGPVRASGRFFAYGSVGIILCASVNAMKIGQLGRASALVFGGILYAGIIITTIPYLVQSYAYYRVSGFHSQIYLSLAPILTSILAYFTLHESVNTIQICSIIFVILGLACTVLSHYHEQLSRQKQNELGAMSFEIGEDQTQDEFHKEMTNVMKVNVTSETVLSSGGDDDEDISLVHRSNSRNNDITSERTTNAWQGMLENARSAVLDKLSFLKERRDARRKANGGQRWKLKEKMRALNGIISVRSFESDSELEFNLDSTVMSSDDGASPHKREVT